MTITRRTFAAIPVAALLLAAGCETSSTTAEPTSRPVAEETPAGMGIARRIEAAHGKSTWTGCGRLLARQD